MYVARRPEDGTIFSAQPESFAARVGGKPVAVEQVADDHPDVLAFLNPPERAREKEWESDLRAMEERIMKAIENKR